MKEINKEPLEQKLNGKYNMALPKEPRQKMINLMYLVLTALLALNVSVEILNAFKTVNSSLEKTNGVVYNSTQTYMASLFSLTQKDETKEKANIWYPFALKAKNLSDSAYNNIQDLKDSLLRATDFNPAKNGDSTYKDDDIEAAQRIIVEKGAGKKLLSMLTTYKTQILGIDTAIKKEIGGPSFPLDLNPPKSKNKGNKTWEAAYFTMTPTVAALTILSKFQNDIRTTENKVVEFCHKQVGQVENRFNQFKPIVEQSATYVMNGEQIDITAGLGAFNSAKKPSVTIDGQAQQINDSGFVRKTFTATGVGSHSVNVVVSYTDQDGIPRSIPRTITYVVGQPTGLSISADDVEVLYVDLENHISINAGVGAEKVHVSSDNGIIKNGERPGVYIAEPAKASVPANITINVDGKGRQVKTFKVRTVPDPIAMVGISKGGRMRVNEFKAQFGVAAVLENFIFQGVKFHVTGYTLVCTGAGFPQLKFADVQGDSFDPVRATMVEQARPGTTVTIDNIRASGPGGSRLLPPIVFNLF